MKVDWKKRYDDLKREHNAKMKKLAEEFDICNSSHTTFLKWTSGAQRRVARFTFRRLRRSSVVKEMKK